MSTGAVSTAAGLTPGTVLTDRFEIQDLIGEGAMGAVYRALDRAAGKPAAVKVLHKHLVTSREYVSRFKREAHAASRFRHDAAVRVLGTGETEDHLPYIAMELVQGRSVKEIIESDAPLPTGRAANLVQQLLGALGAAHRQGIVHRDMKPDNIRVLADADGIERPKILDFGVAKFISGDMGDVTGGLKTKTGVVLGTPKYMAPEQIRGETIDGRADVYAVGAMFHEMLTGKPPFEATDVFGFVAMHLKERVRPITERFPELEVPEELDAIVLQMLSKDPQDRPADAAALAVEVQRFAVEDPAAARKHAALHRGMAVVAGAGAVGAVLGLVLVPRSGSAVALGPPVAAVAFGLGIGAASAAKLFPRPSVYGFVKRLAAVALTVLLFAAFSLLLPSDAGVYVAAAHGLAAVFAYTAYLVVWSSRSRFLRPLAAGLGAPLIAALVFPVRVVPEGAEPYFVDLMGFFTAAARGLAEAERAARIQNFVGLLAAAVPFALGSLALPRPGAAKK